VTRSRGAQSVGRIGGYELVRLLATGSMAEVYEARRAGVHGFSKRLAIKRVLPQLAGDERVVQTFCDEATNLAALAHPNLVQVVDFGEVNGEPYMVMEYIDGISGDQLVSAVRVRQRTVELGPALHIASEVLSALHYVHEVCDEHGRRLGLVHRNVAPKNILLGRSGEVKLGGFGIVRGDFMAANSAPGELKGQVGYVSPEQALGARVDARGDVFSVAAVLCELLIGRPLFSDHSQVEILAQLRAGNLGAFAVHGRGLSGDVQTLLYRALSVDPGQRPASAAVFKAELETCLKRHDAAVGAHGLAAYLVDLGLLRIRSGVVAREAEHACRPEVPTNAERRRPNASPAKGATVVSIEPRVRASAPTLPNATDVVYHLRRESGSSFGPLSLANMLELIATGRVGNEARVSRHGGPVLPLGSVHELARMAARPAYRFFDPVALYASERRSVERVSLPRHLFGLVLGARTGLLCARGKNYQIRLFFREGKVAMSACTDRARLLGVELASARRFSAERLGQIVESAWRAGRRLGEELMVSGMLSPSELRALLNAQHHKRLTALCAANEGELCFVDDAPCEIGAPTLEADPLAVVASAVLEAYEADEIAGLLARAWAMPIRPTPAFDHVLTRLGLPPAERRSLERAAGGRSLAELLGTDGTAQSAADRALLRAVFVGVSSGALRFRRSR
jgi:hypothetical protein